MEIEQPHEENQEEDERTDAVELFGFLVEDHDYIQKLIAGIRGALKRKSITPQQICGLGKLLQGLQRLPLSTPGVDICVSMRNESAGGLSCQSVQLTQSSFELLSGGAEHGPAGSDSYTGFSFLVEVGGFRDDRMVAETEDWMAGFIESFCDEEQEFEVDDQAEGSALDWHEGVLKDYWEKLDSEY
jgi:hypothetical protein